MNQNELTEVFSALADPTRRAILAKLAQGDATVSQLAEPLSITSPSSEHFELFMKLGVHLGTAKTLDNLVELLRRVR